MGAKIIDRDKGWVAILKAVDAMKGESYAKVGIVGERAEEMADDSDLTVAEYGAVNEFGTHDGHVPERSFIRSTFDRMRDELTADARKLLVEVVLDHKISVGKALNILGAKLAAEIKKTITAGDPVPPPNAPSTAARKAAKGAKGKAGLVRTLVDTGRLVGAISWTIVAGSFSQGSGSEGSSEVTADKGGV